MIDTVSGRQRKTKKKKETENLFLIEHVSLFFSPSSKLYLICSTAVCSCHRAIYPPLCSNRVRVCTQKKMVPFGTQHTHTLSHSLLFTFCLCHSRSTMWRRRGSSSSEKIELLLLLYNFSHFIFPSFSHFCRVDPSARAAATAAAAKAAVNVTCRENIHSLAPTLL